MAIRSTAVYVSPIRTQRGAAVDVDQVIATLDAGHDLPSALQLLGSDCLEERESIVWDKYTDDSDATTSLLVSGWAGSKEMWAPDGSFVAPASAEFRSAIEALRSTPSLATLTVLDGMCRGAGQVYFASTSSIVRIDRGMPLPLPNRKLQGWQSTPNPATTHRDLLEPESGFVVWDSDWVLELHFRFRTRLDAVCWQQPVNNEAADAQRVLPKIATVHPFDGGDFAVDRAGNGRFFGVHPAVDPPARTKERNAATVLASIALVGGDASVVVVPEFCLHGADALADSLMVAERGQLPPIVVAGSAHEGDAHRSNTSVTYLDGIELLKVSKYFPFVSRTPTGTFQEDIAPRERVLAVAAGSSTRLAVAVCSDLNSDSYRGALSAAAVNLMVCPSWTPKVGAFAGAMTELAAYSQCISVVANTPGHEAATEPTFWAITMVPRAGSVAEDRFPPDGQTPTYGLLNPNVTPTDADHWRWYD